MSQVGAEGLAEHGYSYQQILAYYYTGTAIGTLPASPTVTVLLEGGSVSIAFAAFRTFAPAASALAGWQLPRTARRGAGDRDLTRGKATAL